MSASPFAKLHRLLQQALEVEFFTIPPYLTALYSIVEGTNLPSVQILQSVVMEEMLHAVQVANLMNAVGATPKVSPRQWPQLKRIHYPSQAPHISRPLVIALLPFSPPAIKAFVEIEQPDNTKSWSKNGGIVTIGQLYADLRKALVAACENHGEAAVFTVAHGNQLTNEDYYGGGGRLIVIKGLDSALQAIEEISQQGEGLVRLTNLTGDEVRFHQPKEVAHYYRFKQILEGQLYDNADDVGAPTGPELPVDWKAVRMFADVVPTAGGPDGFIAVVDAFKRTYDDLLDLLDAAFNGKKADLRNAEIVMQSLKTQAIELMRIDVRGGKTCPPPFWFVKS